MLFAQEKLFWQDVTLNALDELMLFWAGFSNFCEMVDDLKRYAGKFETTFGDHENNPVNPFILIDVFCLFSPSLRNQTLN